MIQSPVKATSARQLLLFVGFACLSPTIWGGIALIASLGALSLMIYPAILFLGGLAGVWGSETLRRRPGHQTHAAIAGTMVGLAATVTLFWTIMERYR